MNKHLSTIALVLFLSTTAFSQETQTPIKRMKVSDIYIQPSVHGEINPTSSANDFYNLAPNSTLLPADLSDYSENTYSEYNGSFAFSFLMGFKFSDKNKQEYKANPTFRIGITYLSGTTLSSNLYKESRSPYDTLTSSLTGEQFPIDSITNSGYSMYYDSDQLRIDASLIYRTNPKARWQIYTGIGITGGVSINATTYISFNEFSYIEPTSTSYVSYYDQNQDNNYKSEKWVNEANFGFGTYIPMGVDFRISNKSEFFKRIHLYYELRPGLSLTSIPEIGTFTNASILHGIGLKVNWD